MNTSRGLGAFAAAVAALVSSWAIAARADEAKHLNPYSGDPEVAKQGRKLFLNLGCSGCHGVMGGGGMGKPILDDTWIFGSDDETLYKLIKGQISNQTMPRTWAGLPDEQVWKLLTYVRSLYKGDPKLIDWSLTPSATPPPAGAGAAAPAAPAFVFKMPKGLEDMEVPTPADNPLTEAKIKLGEMLFFDKRLSNGKAMSCESCHIPEKGWTNGEQFSKKADGTLNTRNTPTLFGVGLYPELYWDGRAKSLEAVVLEEVKTQMGADPQAVAGELEAVPAYKTAFETELGGPPNPERISKAVAAFLRTIYAGNTPFDNRPEGDETSEIAQGFKVYSEVARCSLCHLPPLFSDGLFHNIGVGSRAKVKDPGRSKVILESAGASSPPSPEEVAAATVAFKTGSFRGLSLTGPYFHDGHAKTLEEAATLMMKGGINNPHKDPKLKAWPITPQQRNVLLAFIRSLSPENKPYARPAIP